jgi:cytochrome b subunit of formate dehydrogenase
MSLSHLMLLGIAGVPLLVAQVPASDQYCAACHDQPQKIAGTAHDSVPCLTCHPKHDQFPHPSGIPKPECAACHAEEATREGLGVHGRARAAGNLAAPTCTVCHGGPHELKIPGTAAFRASIPETCGMCHSAIYAQYRQSVHGQALAKGILAAPVCSTCHGEHEIIPPASPASPVHPSHIPETCGRCHANVELDRRYDLPPQAVVSYEESYHGLALKAGRQTVANCASCHGVHNILPSSDPRSTINPKNLPKTCGKCHPGAGTRFAIGPMHWTAGRGEPGPVQWVRDAYGILIPLLIGLMFLHQFGDWARKIGEVSLRSGTAILSARISGAERAAGRNPSSFRMYRAERIQHVILMSCFAVLVWTGFALKYSDQWWAWPLISWERVSGWPVRGVIHRTAGAMLIALSVGHVITLIKDRKLRRHWAELRPVHGDVMEGVRNFLYVLRLTGARPRLSPHSYVEKAEYWAVVWGTAVMAATGVLLWANTLVLTYLPKIVLDVCTAIHFYEALLATLAILVWHFYTVIFDPEVYPMDPAWLTGYSTRKRDADEKTRG